MKDSDTIYEFSYEVDAVRHEFWETPDISEGTTVPLDIFQHASTIQALARYLVDVHSMSFADVGRKLGRSSKTIWASYHQIDRLPIVNEDSIRVPLALFTGTLPPLEALVSYLRKNGLRNVDIAQALNLSPKTTHTAWARSEVRR